MIRPIAILLALLLLVFAPAQAQPTRAPLPAAVAVRLLLIGSDAHPIDEAEAETRADQVRAALAWWSARVPTALTLDSVERRDRWPPADGLAASPPGTATIYLAGDPGIEAWGDYTLRSVYMETGLTGRQFESTVAHEVGHAVFNLVDLYYWEELCPEGEPDIMCAARTAYDRGVVGCRSLKRLGIWCQVTYIPALVAGDRSDR